MAAVTRVILSKSLQKISPRSFFGALRHIANKAPDPSEIDLDKPITYSTSKAATWQAESSFRGSDKKDVSPWYQTHVVVASMTAFMLYFFILREENDLDEGLSTTLYDRIDGLEEVQLKALISYYKEYDPGYDRTALEERLAHLESLRNNH